MNKLLKYLKGYRRSAVVAPLLKYVEAFIELLIPFLVEAMIDDGINADGETNSHLFMWLEIDAGSGSNTDIIIWLGCIMVGLGLIGLGFSLACQYLASKAAVGFGCNIRKAMFNHIQNIETQKLDQIGTSTLVNRLSSDVAATQLGVAMFLRLMLRAPFLVIGAIIMCILVAPQLWFIYVIAAALSFGVLILVMRLSVPKYTDVMHQLDGVSSLTGETVKGGRVIRAWGGEQKQKDKFEKQITSHTKAATMASFISCLLNPAVSLIINIAIALILSMSTGDIVSGSMSTGTLVAVINYMTQMLLSFITLALLMVIISKALTGAKRVNEVFELEVATYGAGAIAKGDNVLKFNNASFSFGGNENALNNVSFSLARGQLLGVIGTTGSGKSVFASLCAGLIYPTSGSVKLLGNETTEYTKKQLAENVAFAPQKALLFSGTIRSNLEWGSEDEQQATTMLKMMQADKFVTSKGGLDGEVLQKGANFSGGEKQRISLARTMLKQAPLVVLDDAASALDYVTESKIKKMVVSKASDSGLVIISSRIGMIKNAHQIIVLDGGHVVGQGTHKELLSSCALYKQMNAKA